MQRYFAGDLRPDQEKSWRAEDGIFVLHDEAMQQIATLDVYIAFYEDKMDLATRRGGGQFFRRGRGQFLRRLVVAKARKEKLEEALRGEEVR